MDPGQTSGGHDLGIGKLRPHPLDKHFVAQLNVGELMEMWTGGNLKATRHRVPLNEGEESRLSRQSVVFFVIPGWTSD